MTTGERMRLRRKELGLSAEYVADKLGCSATTIYRYEKGDIEKMPVDVLNPLSVILCTTPEFLMGWAEKSSCSVTTNLTLGEDRLLSLYRALNEEGREKLVDYADDMVRSGKYQKNSSLRLADKQA